MKRIHAETGTPPLRDFTPDFSGVARIICGQQLSAASASAIWSRLAAAYQPFVPESLLAASDAELQALGLSRSKVRTIKGIATTILAAKLDFSSLNTRRDDDIRAALTGLHGVGPWTADIYLLFALRRRDAFASGDLALQIAAQRLLGLSTRPTAIELETIAERWRPYRAIAARLLWADYAVNRLGRPND